MIDIPRRELRLDVPDAELAERRERLLASLGSYRPADRQRPVSAALQVYAALATSASTGAVAGHQPPRCCPWLCDPRPGRTAAVWPVPARARPLTSAAI